MIAVPSRLLQLAHQVEDLRLDGDVERRGRLVGDQHLGIARQRHGDHHALAHAARELVRIGVRAPLGLGDADAAQHLDRAVPGVALARQALVQRDRLGDLLAAPCSTGLSEVIGSWKIIEISLPRMRSISGSLSSSRSRPSKRIAPPTMRPGGLATRRRIDSAVTLLPQPDSPTTPSVSPRLQRVGDAVDGAHRADRR